MNVKEFEWPGRGYLKNNGKQNVLQSFCQLFLSHFNFLLCNLGLFS